MLGHTTPFQAPVVGYRGRRNLRSQLTGVSEPRAIQRFSLSEPGIGQDIVLHAEPADRIFTLYL